jgi:hypothetical protein
MKTPNVSKWQGNMAIASDALQQAIRGTSGIAGASTIPAIAHKNTGWNIARADGSCKWFAAAEMIPANHPPVQTGADPLGENNTYSDAGNHTGAMAFWSIASSYALPYN